MLIERSTQDAVILLKEKDAYLHALLGEFGNNRFIARLKAEFISLLDNNGFPNSNPLTHHQISESRFRPRIPFLIILMMD